MTTLYFPGWGIYGRNHFLSDIDVRNVEAITYAFFGVNGDGSLKTLDAFEWGQKAFTSRESVSGVADVWHPDARHGNKYQFEQLADMHPDLKLNVALGGWTQSAEFSTAVLDENRGKLVGNILDFAQEHLWITGIDLDWEFPGSGGAPGNAQRIEDGENYGKLLAELRDGLDVLGAVAGKQYTLSLASPPGLAQVDTFGFDLGIAEHADVINFMSYDYHGGWESQTGLQAGIFDTYSGNDQLGIAATLRAMLDKGVDLSKVNLGIPLYARGWRIDDKTAPEDALGAPSHGLAVGSFERGIYDAKDILEQIRANSDAWTVVYDTDAMGAYAVGLDGTFVSIETRSTVALKTAWAEVNGFNGIMFWDSSGDPAGAENSLVKAGNDVWHGVRTVADVVESDPIQFDLFTGNGDFYDLLSLDGTGDQISIFGGAAVTDEKSVEPANIVEVSSPEDEMMGEHDHHGHHRGGDYLLDIGPETLGSTIAFNVRTDIVHFWPTVDAADVQIFGESGDALGETVRIAISHPDRTIETFILTDVAPGALSIDNFQFNGNVDLTEKVSAFLGFDVDAATGNSRFTTQDDGSGIPEINGYTDEGGRLFDATPGGVDVRDFVIGRDKIDLGGQSVHGVIVGENQDGDLVILSPWAPNDHQIFVGTKVSKLSVDDFAVVGNEHFRQDLGAVLSFTEIDAMSETGRVLITGHRYGHEQVIHGFDPKSHILDLRYLNTRERLMVEETDEGLRIRIEPTGDTTILAGVTRADLVGRNIHFHHDQVIEDNVEVPFGFSAEQVTLAGREGFVTPYAPLGESTDGFQVRLGTHTGGLEASETRTEETVEDPAQPENNDDREVVTPVLGDNGGSIKIDWAWGSHVVVEAFDTSDDVIEIGWIGPAALSVSDTSEGVAFAIDGNNQSTVLAGVTLSDLNTDNFTIRDPGSRDMIEALIRAADGGHDHVGEPVETEEEQDVTIETPPQPPTSEPQTPTMPASQSNGKEIRLDWNWGQDSAYEFNPNTDSFYIGWFSPDALTVMQEGDGLRFSVESNNQSILLNDIRLDELSIDNFTSPSGGVMEYMVDLL